mmetsp:Transcript_2803/g.5320  ORF Transcript_2803/g.5320 Transcript_2803/m.5320 type:complete len:477 (+) Transcript_2803:38-1468(+)
MWDSDSEAEAEAFIPAVLNRPKVANHVVHESFSVDMRDHEDHTFCGIMFDLRCRDSVEGGAPIEFIQINAVSVRGYLGPLTVWTTVDTYRHKEHEEELWELVYQRDHEPSRINYCQLDLSKPIRLTPGQRCGLYVHSKLPGDEAIVYDNQRSEITYQDEALQVFPGLAHLSNKPFGRRGMWGYPWRLNREFVGRLCYGVSYKLWNPEVHHHFPAAFQRAVKVSLLCARRPESPLNRLQDDIILYILNMCKYDWFSPARPPRPPQSARQQHVEPTFRRIWTMVMGSSARPTALNLNWRTRHELLGGIGRGAQRPEVEVSEASDNGASDSESSSPWRVLETFMPDNADGGNSNDAAGLDGADDADVASSVDGSARHVQGDGAVPARLRQRRGRRKRRPENSSAGNANGSRHRGDAPRMVWRPVGTSAGEAASVSCTSGAQGVAAAAEHPGRRSSKGKSKGKGKGKGKGSGKGGGKNRR